MIIDLFHNKIVNETMTDSFRDSVNDVLVPLLVGKYGDTLERITMYEDYIGDDFLYEGEWYYPLTVKLQDSEAFTSWIKWPVSKKTFSNAIPYSYEGSGKVAFDFAGFVPGGFADKLQGRKIDYNQNAISFNIEALAADPLLLVGKYSQTFVDELASQITDVLSRALGISGIPESTMELQLVFAPNTYLEHTSENVTYRRLLLVDKGCQARDFWIKWTRLDSAVGYKLSDHVSSDAIQFDLGEDVAQKIREKEYRFLAGANPDKYQAAMGKKTVTEWREIPKRAIKRGDVVKVVSEAELAQHASDISDKLRAILGEAAPIATPVEKTADDSFDLVAALAKSVLEKEEVAEESVEAVEELADVAEELPEIEIEEYIEESEVIEETIEEPVEELVAESVEEIAEELVEELAEEPAEELADQPAEESADELDEVVEESIEVIEEETAEAVEEEMVEEIKEEVAEEVIATPAAKPEPLVIDNSFEFDFGGFSDGSMFETVAETPAPEAETESVVPTPSLFVDEEALRREIEAKIRLEYETEARLKAEREAEQLRLEHERLIEENERLARIAKEAEEKRIAEEEAKKAEEEARRLAEEERQRELEAKKVEEERIRAEIEEKLRLEARERERVAEAARMAVEEQKRLEAERAEKALREREEALARESERLRREEEERRALEEKRLEEQRRREEEERRKLEEEEARRQVVIVSKRAKLMFRYAVDVNVIKRIKEVVEETLVSSGKEKLNIHIKAYPQDSNSITLDIKIPQNEMDLLVSMMKALGGASLGITKIILE